MDYVLDTRLLRMEEAIFVNTLCSTLLCLIEKGTKMVKLLKFQSTWNQTKCTWHVGLFFKSMIRSALQTLQEPWHDLGRRRVSLCAICTISQYFSFESLSNRRQGVEWGGKYVQGGDGERYKNCWEKKPTTRSAPGGSNKYAAQVQIYMRCIQPCLPPIQNCNFQQKKPSVLPEGRQD